MCGQKLTPRSMSKWHPKKMCNSSAYKNCEALKTNNKINMDKIKNLQTEQIILNKQNTLLLQQGHNVEIQEHKQNTSTLDKYYEELKAEMTQVKKYMQK